MSRGRVLVVGSSASVLPLKDGRTFPTGNYLNETVIPIQMLLAAGYEVVVATPDGTRPPLDARSLSAVHFDGVEAVLRSALAFYTEDPLFMRVVTLRSAIQAGLDDLVGFFIPGGHAPIADLVANPELGEILRFAHLHGRPTALLCHGPVALLAAMPWAQAFQEAMIKGNRAAAIAAASDWPYRDYRMTVFSNSEEQPVQANVLGGSLQYPVADALRLAGASIQHGPDYAPYVVSDRELITGQNPRSDREFAARFIEALNASSVRTHQHAASPAAASPT